MRISAKGRAFIEKFEGLFLTAYNDGAGVCTIGYGHTDEAGLPTVHYGMTCTKEQADQWLTNDLTKVEAEINRLVTVPVNQNQYDALGSFQFNTGALGRSTLLKKLNSGYYAEVPEELLKWDHAGGKVMKGLSRRRAAEAAMWSGSAPAQPAPEPASRWGWVLDLLVRIFGGKK